MAKKKTVDKPEPKLHREPDFCVYIGPTIRGVFSKGQIFATPRDEILKRFYAEIERIPTIEHLIVPGAELAEARINVNTPGNQLYNYYQILANSKD